MDNPENIDFIRSANELGLFTVSSDNGDCIPDEEVIHKGKPAIEKHVQYAYVSGFILTSLVAKFEARLKEFYADTIYTVYYPVELVTDTSQYYCEPIITEYTYIVALDGKPLSEKSIITTGGYQVMDLKMLRDILDDVRDGGYSDPAPEVADALYNKRDGLKQKYTYVVIRSPEPCVAGSDGFFDNVLTALSKTVGH